MYNNKTFFFNKFKFSEVGIFSNYFYIFNNGQDLDETRKRKEEVNKCNNKHWLLFTKLSGTHFSDDNLEGTQLRLFSCSL